MIAKRTQTRSAFAGLVLTSLLSFGGLALADTAPEPAPSVDREEAWQRFLAQEQSSEGTASMKKAETSVLSGGISSSTIGGLLAVMFGGFGVLTVMGAKGKVPQLTALLGNRMSPVEAPRDDVQVVAIRSLGNNNALAVVEVFEQRLVLGVSQGQVSLLTRIGEGGNISETTVDHNTPDDFGAVLGSMVTRAEQAPAYTNEVVNAPWGARVAAQAASVEAMPAPGPRNLGNTALREDTFTPIAPQKAQAEGQSLDEVLQAVLNARRGKASAPAEPTLPAPTVERAETPAAYGRRGHPVAAATSVETKPAQRSETPPAPAATPRTSQGELPRPARPAWRQVDTSTPRVTRESGAADQVVRRLQTMRRFR